MNRWLVGMTAVAFLSAPAVMAASTRTTAKVVPTTSTSALDHSGSQLNKYALGWLDAENGSKTATSESHARPARTQDDNVIAWSNSGTDVDKISEAAAGDEQFASLVSLTSAASLSDQLNPQELEHLQSEAGRQDLIALLKARGIDGPLADTSADEIGSTGAY